MARVTNSDTLPYVDSRYELGMLASQRVRDLNGGVHPVVETKGDKPTVVALREIASGNLDIDQVRHEFIESYKDKPQNAENIESKSEDPKIKNFAAELAGFHKSETSEPSESEEEYAKENSDDTPDSDENEE